ncbi:hypothetical protein OAD50_01460 [Vicingaceae bacterium]|nr:hypothetical protein [Vicingaceae bacterium]
MSKRKDLLMPLLLFATLGLAPFFPEPHLWGKIKWILGGAVGMTGKDWFDFIMHGSPFIYLAYKIIKRP